VLRAPAAPALINHPPLCVPFPSPALRALSSAAVLPGKSFDAGKTLEAMTAQRSTVLVATPAQVAALSAALAEDAAKPVAKRTYDLSTLRAGLVSE
jgi:hypothetical protein